MNRRFIFLAIAMIAALVSPGYGGGPLAVGGESLGVAGKPFLWDSSVPVPYRTPSAGALGKLDNALAVARVQKLFQVWEDVPTSAIRFQNAGAIQATGAYTGGAVDTLPKFLAVDNACVDGSQTPIIFDSNGSLFRQLGMDESIIGFAGPCAIDGAGHIIAAEAVLNGGWIDGIPANGELTDNQFDHAFVHEFGHLSGLDHSQISVGVLNQPHDQCGVDLLAGLPVMFPFLHCQARPDAGLPMLAEDDQAWISYFYPETADDADHKRVPFDQVYGVISGNILFEDGESLAQDVNVIAADSNGANAMQSSNVSGYLFTGNPGQQVSGTNFGGSRFGSRDPRLIGHFDIPVRAGTYDLRVERINENFIGGSGVGPLVFPIGRTTGGGKTGVTVAAGAHVTGLNVLAVAGAPRFDAYEAP